MAGEASRTRVLVVDDDEDMRMVIAASLEFGGFEVQLAVGADDARKALEHDPADVVLLDVMMPGTNGLELLEEMRGRPETERMPVLLYTCLSTPDVAHAAKRAGFAVALVKPATATQLGAAISSLVGLR